MMVIAVLLWYLGVQLSAPVWYYVCCALIILFRVISFGLSMYKKGRDGKC